MQPKHALAPGGKPERHDPSIFTGIVTSGNSHSCRSVHYPSRFPPCTRPLRLPKEISPRAPFHADALIASRRASPAHWRRCRRMARSLPMHIRRPCMKKHWLETLQGVQRWNQINHHTIGGPDSFSFRCLLINGVNVHDMVVGYHDLLHVLSNTRFTSNLSRERRFQGLSSSPKTYYMVFILFISGYGWFPTRRASAGAQSGILK